MRHARRRCTRAVDMFAVGCIFFFVLTGGFHVNPTPVLSARGRCHRHLSKQQLLIILIHLYKCRLPNACSRAVIRGSNDAIG